MCSVASKKPRMGNLVELQLPTILHRQSGLQCHVHTIVFYLISIHRFKAPFEHSFGIMNFSTGMPKTLTPTIAAEPRHIHQDLTPGLPSTN